MLKSNAGGSAATQAFDNSGTSLVATTTQAAIVELAGDVLGVPPIVDTSTTNQDNLAPTGLQHGSVLLLQGAGSNGISGIAALDAESVITVINDTDDYLKWLSHESTSSLAANRISLPGSFPGFLMPGDSIVLRYSTRKSRWTVISWANRGQSMGLTEFSDFFGSNGPWQVINSGTGAGIASSSNGIVSPEFAMGATAITTGTDTTGRASLGSGNSVHIVPGRGPLLSVARMNAVAVVDAVNTFAIYSGFHDFQIGTLTDGIAWEYRWNGSAPELCQTVAVGTTVARSTTGAPTVPSAGVYTWLVVFVNSDGTRADFIYSTDGMTFTKASSVSSGLPGATDYIAYDQTIIKSAGTSARLAAIDLMGYRADQLGRG